MSTGLVFSELSNVVEINWYDENDEVVVVPRDQLRFSIQKDRAIKALKNCQGRRAIYAAISVASGETGWMG